MRRACASGFSLLWPYNHNRERSTALFNDIDQYAEHFTYLSGTNPRHRMQVADIWDLP